MLLELLSPAFFFKCFTLFLTLTKNKYNEIFDLELYRGYPVLLKALLRVPYSRGFLVESAKKKNHNILVIREKDMPEWKCFYLLFGLEKYISDPVKILYPKKQSQKSAPEHHVIGIVFGSSFNWPQKKWPRQKFIETLEHLNSANHSFILFGAAHEKEEGTRFQNELSFQVENTVGNLNYQGLIQKIHECKMILGNDTGTLHLASACGVPSVTLFGPTNHLKWNSFFSLPVFTDISCRPCYYLSHMPACSHINCLNKMEVNIVLNAVEKVLKTSITIN